MKPRQEEINIKRFIAESWPHDSGAGQASLTSTGPPVRKDRRELLGMGHSCRPQKEFLLQEGSLRSALKAFHSIDSEPPDDLE